MTLGDLADAFYAVERRQMHVTCARVNPKNFAEFKYSPAPMGTWDDTSGELWGATIIADEAQPEGTCDLDYRANPNGPRTVWDLLRRPLL